SSPPSSTPRSRNGPRWFERPACVWSSRPMESAFAVTPGVTRQLARFVAETRPADVPDEVVHEAKRALLNWLGCAIGGCRHPAVETALAALAPFAGPPEASVLGRTERLDCLHAALLNGISSHVLDFDDTHHPTLIHPSGPVISAALALAERQLVPG